MKTETIKSDLKGLAKSIGNAAITALLVWLSQFTTGCTTVIVPSDEAPTVSLTGAVPLGIQLNTKTNNN